MSKDNKKIISVSAVIDNLPKVIDFINEQLDKDKYSLKTVTELELAAEEIFTNISSYAYAPEIGNVEITVNLVESTPEIIISFGDKLFIIFTNS